MLDQHVDESGAASVDEREEEVGVLIGELGVDKGSGLHRERSEVGMRDDLDGEHEAQQVGRARGILHRRLEERVVWPRCGHSERARCLR